jgi:DNA excision repair protein ERCC-4
MVERIMSRIYIYADNREIPSGIPELLRKQQITVYTKNLTVADYIISDRCAIERKSVNDFISSVFDGRLIDQFNRLSKSYNIPILVIEGDTEEIYNDPSRKKLFLKILMELSIDYSVRVFFTFNSKLTVDFIISLAQYEQIGRSKHPLTRKKPRHLSRKDLLKFILMGFPAVGSKLAENLLLKFGNLRNIFTSTKAEIARTKSVGRQLSEQIINIIDYPYDEEDKEKIRQKKLENSG